MSFLHLQRQRISQLASYWFPACRIFQFWRWIRYVTLKRRLTFSGLRGVISQKTELFITAGGENLKSHKNKKNSSTSSWRWWSLRPASLLGLQQRLPSFHWSSTFSFSPRKTRVKQFREPTIFYSLPIIAPTLSSIYNFFSYEKCI
jgi:hypothetical protein